MGIRLSTLLAVLPLLAIAGVRAAEPPTSAPPPAQQVGQIAVPPVPGSEMVPKPVKFEDGVAAYAARDYRQAFEIWETLAEKGNSNAQYWLGVMYEKGQYVVYSGDDALKWYHSAAENNNPEAQYRLAVALEQGQGMEANPMMAVFWYARAAANGHENAQTDLERLQKDIDQVVEQAQAAALLRVREEARSEGFEEGVAQAGNPQGEEAV